MNVLILEDHLFIPDYLISIFNELKLEVDFHRSVNEFEALVQLEEVDISYVICDLRLAAGISLVIPRYCFEHQIPYMVFSSFVSSALIEELLLLKVKCYVSKSSETRFLKIGLQSLISGAEFFCPIVELERGRKEIKDKAKPLLSKSEFRVFLAYSKGLPTVEVAELLNLSVNTVRNHRARAMDKNFCSFNELLLRFNYWME